ncbi:trimethyllysine dioxygenase TmlH [Penicillium taxi]|uniref:trimethyllysine dioxygenase TmlH n=1 Tax=Penicillium taxi TaxID=168475 RepID=UPI002545174B|nr:trimethyllysine dioxygenase TmlH [Penicillium taxi]KAJ5908991.1 trimethyllysine dioxygenase TmlH [Penicillium taxi]
MKANYGLKWKALASVSARQIPWKTSEIKELIRADRFRDNCQCSKCIHPDTLQRASDTFSIPEDVKVEDLRIYHDRKVVINCKYFTIYDSIPLLTDILGSDGHKAIYPLGWLVAHRQNKIAEAKQGHEPKTYELKDLPSINRKGTLYKAGDPYPEVLYEDVMSKDSSVSEWLEKIYDMGFCFVKDVPVNPKATKTLIERIAFIRHTHYGGFWDFTADLSFKDTAYTNEALGGHTDNTYFTDPARLQLFHILSHTDGDGGHNLLVDAFEAARVLRSEDPKLFQALVSERHPFHASGNEDVCIQPSARAPVFNIHPDTGSLYQVRWNNYDRAPKTDWAVEEQKVWYKAARRYNEIVNQPSSQIWTQLKPGNALIFDNWRMLHGRSEFTGKRRMCGGYVNNDDFISRLRLLKYGREKVLKYLGVVSGEEGNPNSFY